MLIVVMKIYISNLLGNKVVFAVCSPFTRSTCIITHMYFGINCNVYALYWHADMRKHKLFFSCFSLKILKLSATTGAKKNEIKLEVPETAVPLVAT